MTKEEEVGDRSWMSEEAVECSLCGMRFKAEDKELLIFIMSTHVVKDHPEVKEKVDVEFKKVKIN